MEERIELEEDVIKPKKNKLMLVFFIVTPLLIGLLLFLVFMLYTGAGNSGFNDPGQQAQPRFTQSMGEYQVNLADAGGKRYLRVQMHAAYNESRLQKELDRRNLEIRSVVIALLRAKTVEDLQEPGGQDALQEEIIGRLNEMLVSGELKQLYFTEFIIQ